MGHIVKTAILCVSFLRIVLVFCPFNTPKHIPTDISDGFHGKYNLMVLIVNELYGMGTPNHFLWDASFPDSIQALAALCPAWMEAPVLKAPAAAPMGSLEIAARMVCILYFLIVFSCSSCVDCYWLACETFVFILLRDLLRPFSLSPLLSDWHHGVCSSGPCTNTPCKNGGRCENGCCTCPPGFSGYLCEIGVFFFFFLLHEIETFSIAKSLIKLLAAMHE